MKISFGKTCWWWMHHEEISWVFWVSFNIWFCHFHPGWQDSPLNMWRPNAFLKVFWLQWSSGERCFLTVQLRLRVCVQIKIVTPTVAPHTYHEIPLHKKIQKLQKKTSGMLWDRKANGFEVLCKIYFFKSRISRVISLFIFSFICLCVTACNAISRVQNLHSLQCMWQSR